VDASIARCKGAGSPQVEHHGANMADRGQIKDLFSFIKDKFGRTPDIVVNNAGRKTTYNVKNYSGTSVQRPHLTNLCTKATLDIKLGLYIT